jgi:hypothetical protein
MDDRVITEPKPCEGCPEKTIQGHRTSRRRFLWNGLLAGLGLFLSRFLPPLARPVAAQCPEGCNCKDWQSTYCKCGVCCESWVKDLCSKYKVRYMTPGCHCLWDCGWYEVECAPCLC